MRNASTGANVQSWSQNPAKCGFHPVVGFLAAVPHPWYPESPAEPAEPDSLRDMRPRSFVIPWKFHWEANVEKGKWFIVSFWGQVGLSVGPGMVITGLIEQPLERRRSSVKAALRKTARRCSVEGASWLDFIRMHASKSHHAYAASCSGRMLLTVLTTRSADQESGADRTPYDAKCTTTSTGLCTTLLASEGPV